MAKVPLFATKVEKGRGGGTKITVSAGIAGITGDRKTEPHRGGAENGQDRKVGNPTGAAQVDQPWDGIA
jgi:hypothetical protein